MKKRWTGIAAVLTASLAFGGVGTTYGATLTLAGFGADQTVEETAAPVKKEAAAEKTPAVTEKETAQTQEEITVQTEAQTETPAAVQTKTGEKLTEAAAEAQTEAVAEVQTEAAAEAQTEAAAEAQTEAATEAQTEAPIDRSMVDTTGFAKADDYVNVRASGDTEGEVVGTLRLNDSVYIEDVDENGWYKVRSGNVEGYVAGYLIATGEEAEEIAQNTAYTYASVGAETLNVRSDASQDGEILDTVGQNSDLEVVEDLGDWVKVVTDDGIYGYVSADYVDTQTVYATGETVQEQSEREEQEYLAWVEQQEAAYADASYADQEYTDSSWTDAAQTDTTWTDAVPAAESYGNVDALYQAYLEAQEAAMSPVDEEDAAVKANAAIEAYNAYLAACGTTQSAETWTDAAQTDTTWTDAAPAAESYGDVDALYQAYLEAQEAAMSPVNEEDAVAKANAAIEAYNAYLAACGSSESVASVEQSYTDAVYTDDTTYTDDGYTDDTYTDDTYEDTYTEDTYEDSYTEDTGSYEGASSSGVGAQVANYALQYVGNPYVYGGASLTGGADCSGFTMAVYSNFGVGLPHNAAAQSGCGTPVSLSDLQAGDLIFYGDGEIGHVAIYCGDGTVVHASNEETGIRTSVYNYRNPVAAVRLV